MLRQRVITAIVLLALLLPALFASNPWPFAVLTALLLAAGAWEWGRLNAGGSALAWLLGLLVAAACALILWQGWHLQAPAGAWWIVAALWLLGGAWALRIGPGGWPALPPALRWLLGAAILVLAWLALAQSRSIGLNFILSVFALVWVADIAAYAGGRSFGKRKLAPSISPGKSWEGVFSGWLGVALLAALWIWLDGRIAVDSASLYTRLWRQWGGLGLAVALLLLAGMSVVGDLFESLVKRAAGQKDSSGLLPGHGGVLDRIDALLPVFPIAVAMVSIRA
jgi:phosphatidate cytidylyltransferase